MKPSSPQRAAVVSLGCPKNLVDSEVLLGVLARKGFSIVRDPRDAEFLIVNTCGFIADAKKESIEAVLDAARLKKKGRLRVLAVAGCLAQRYGAELKEELPEIDVLLGLDDLEAAADRLLARDLEAVPRSFPPSCYLYRAETPRILSTPPHTAYMKISEGCGLSCSFCAIPAIRGPHRSRGLPDLLREARNLARRGVREINLVAQDSSAYGTDRSGRSRTAELLKRLSRVEGLEWVRLHYLVPSRFTVELLKTLADTPKICPYIDLPLQHVNDRILKRMKRVGNRAFLERMVGTIRRTAPQAALRSTFLVGFPGETEKEFGELLDFIRDAGFDHAGFFPYSPEEGTPAACLPDPVPEPLKIERYNRAVRVQEEAATAAHERWVGRRMRAVVEGRRQGRAFGRVVYQAPEVDGVTWFEGPLDGRPGRFLDVEVTGVVGPDLLARPSKPAVRRDADA